jgi:asparagine synthase (glutamine-hydrolysing)
MRVGQKGRNALIALDGDVADGIAQSAVWADYGDLGRLSPWLARRSPPEPTPRNWRRNLVNSERGLPGAAMATDFRSYLPEDILVKVDRASMLCSLEVRAPFLDRRVVEFAYRSVPNRLRVSLKERKILLKRLAKRLLPESLDLNRKQGFTIPISEWIGPKVVDGWREECADQIRSILSGREAAGFLRRRNGQAADHFLYAMIMLTSWMRQYRISV